MSDGRDANWWTGFFLGMLKGIYLRSDVPKSVRTLCNDAVKDFMSWEADKKKETP